uniref:Chitin-binding type-2 domain-containing protein n=1 Tax=Globodera rostochiensis TaxID=31243 RepID=A0A914H6W0_GLORO
MAQRFVNIVLAVAFFIEPVALQGNRLRCYQGINGVEVPYELSLRLAKWETFPNHGMTECVSDDRVCTFFECKAQDWYFASCSKQHAFCNFEMQEYCVQDKCQTCHTDHCNLPLSMRPNSTTTTRTTSTTTTTRATSTSTRATTAATTTRATSTSTTTRATTTSSLPLAKHLNTTTGTSGTSNTTTSSESSKSIAKGISTKIDITPAKTTQIPETTMQDGHNKTNSENGTSEHGVEEPLAHKRNGTDKSAGLSAKVAPLYVLGLLLAISQAFLWFIEKMPWARAVNGMNI